MKNNRIGIFDSGIGGITVLKEIISKLPNEDIIYFGDNKNAPYGEKEQSQILEQCINVTEFLNNNQCKGIVIACNTATAAALKTLKKRFSIPVIGVIQPGAKAAIKKSKNKKIAVLATPFTCKTEAYSKEIHKIEKEFQVHNIPCKNLCPMIEAGWENQSNREEILNQYITKIPKDTDTVILGCTHYPLIKTDIEKKLKKQIITDPGLESALELERVLTKKRLLNDKKNPGNIEFFLSGEVEQFKHTAEGFLGFEILKIKKIDL